MNLAGWLEKIQQGHPKDWDLGLDRVGEVSRRLGVLKPAGTVFLIAGTNGKGSTCEFLASYCRTLGLSYGKATSPFLQSYNEQIVVNNQVASDETIVAAFAEIEAVRGDISLSYFEFGALAALIIFKAAELDVAILEIGLGGRLDAMNIVDPDVSIITKIALDHQDWLGDTRELIAIEKAGVMRQGKPVVLVDPEAPASLQQEADRQGAKASMIGRDFEWQESILKVGENNWLLPKTRLPVLSGVAATVAMVEAGFQVNQDVLTRALSEAALPGRCQHIAGAPNWLLDVAHNPNAAAYLAGELSRRGLHQVQAIVGMFKDKDAAGVFQHLSPYIAGWHMIDLPGERGATAAHLAGVLSDSCGSTGKTYDKVQTAVEAAIDASDPEGTVLVFGSFVSVAAVLNYLGA